VNPGAIHSNNPKIFGEFKLSDSLGNRTSCEVNELDEDKWYNDSQYGGFHALKSRASGGHVGRIAVFSHDTGTTVPEARSHVTSELTYCALFILLTYSWTEDVFKL